MGILDVPAITAANLALVRGRARSAAPSLVPPSALTSPPTVSFGKVQGVSGATVSAGGSGYVVGDQITLTGGTALQQAILQVTAVSTGAATGVSVVLAGAYTTNPTNPAAQGSTTGTGTGATFTLTLAGGSAAAITAPNIYSPTGGAIRFTGNGPTNISSSGFYGNTTGNGTATLWEWTTDAARVEIRTGALNTFGMLYVDGQRVDATGFTTDATGTLHIYLVDFSGVVKPRTFRLFSINSALGGVRVPATASAWLPNHARRPIAWVLGDSYTYGTGATHQSMSYANGMCDLLGIEAVPDGIGGTGWLSTAGNDPATRVTAKLATLTRTVDYVFLALGYNDSGGNMTTLATNFDATVAAVRTAAPRSRIIVLGPWTPMGATANLTTVKTTVSGRCTALGLTFIDIENWVSSSNRTVYTSGDNTHPNQAGHDYLAGRLAQAVSTVL